MSDTTTLEFRFTQRSRPLPTGNDLLGLLQEPIKCSNHKLMHVVGLGHAGFTVTQKSDDGTVVVRITPVVVGAIFNPKRHSRSLAITGVNPDDVQDLFERLSIVYGNYIDRGTYPVFRNN